MSRLSRSLALGLAAVLLAPVAAASQAERRPPPAREPQRQPTPAPDRQAKPREAAPERAPARTGSGRADRDRDCEPDRDHQRQAVPAVRRPVVVRGRVFVRGYFYDPFIDPYPFWPYGVHPYWYAPLYEMRAFVRVKATPRDASVYADGYYAGLVDEFDGVLQSLPLSPGGHQIVLYRHGYRPSTHNVYLQRGSTFTLTDALALLAPGEPQPPPPVPLPEWWRDDTSAAVPSIHTATLDIRVRPAEASIVLDGQAWRTPEAGRLQLAVTAGGHQLRVAALGYVPFVLDIDVEAGRTTPVNVSLVPDSD